MKHIIILPGDVSPGCGRHAKAAPVCSGRSLAALNAECMEVSPMPITLDRRQALIAAATGICGIAHGAHAPALSPRASVPLIPRRLLFADPARSVVRISPDGRRIAFLA